jgi:hypothetical protein
METDRAPHTPFYLEQLRSLPVILVSLFVVVAGVDVLLALAPGLLVTLREWWATPSSGSTTSSALAAATTIVGGVALAAVALAAFIRGVRSAPYLCITPVWVCACMLAIARVQTPLPLPVPTSAFVAISALLFVGSGVLFESTSRLSNLIGTAASILPLTLLSIGYAFNTTAQASFGGDSLLMLFVLALAAAGAPAIAIACRANGARVLGGPAAALDPVQVAELLERLRETEERAAHAERQLMTSAPVMAGAAPRLALGDDELALARSSGGASWIGWAAAAVVFVIAGAGYALGYAPLKSELETAQANAKQAEDSATKLMVLQRDSQRKQHELEQRLATAAAAAPAQPDAQPPAANSPAPKGSHAVALARESDSSDDADDASDASAEREARRQARLAKREAAQAEREEKAAERAANREAAKKAREEERAAKAEEREKERAERAAAHDEKVAERKARAAEKAEARAAEREQRAAERAEKAEARAAAREARAAERGDKAEDKTDEKVERSAASAATAALEQEAYGSNRAKASKPEKAPPKPAAKSEADVENDSSDDPLEGL